MEFDEKLTLMKEYLAAEGYRPEVEDPGDLIFKAQGKPVIIRCHEHDESYYRVVQPFAMFEELDVPQLALANQVAGHIKAVKLARFHQYFAAVVECFYSTLGEFQANLARCLIVTGHAIDEYVEALADLEQRSQSGYQASDLADPSSVSAN